MASRKIIVEVLMEISACFPNFGKGSDVELVVSTWQNILSGYSDEDVEHGTRMALGECKFPPSPAHVIEQIRKRNSALSPSRYDLWARCNRALEEAHFRNKHRFLNDMTDTEEEPLWESLPQIIRDYFANEVEFNATAEKYDAEAAEFEKGRFLKAFDELENRRAILVLERLRETELSQSAIEQGGNNGR